MQVVSSAVFLIFLIKFAFISISTKNQTFCPFWCSCHLLTNFFKGHILWCFDNHFIVYMSNNEAVGECLHGIHQQISCNSLNDVFYKFRSIAFKPVPFLLSVNAHICNRFTAKLILSNVWLCVSKSSAAWKFNKQKTCLIREF